MKDIPGYEGIYKINEFGMVYSVLKKKYLKQYDTGYGYYAVGLHKNKKCTNYFIHRLIALVYIENPQNMLLVDHKDGDITNNCINNLRWCSYSQNVQNSKKMSSSRNITSKHKGVSAHKRNNKWRARISINGKQKYLGIFDTQIEAAKAYNEYAAMHYREFAKLNTLK